MKTKRHMGSNSIQDIQEIVYAKLNGHLSCDRMTSRRWHNATRISRYLLACIIRNTHRLL